MGARRGSSGSTLGAPAGAASEEEEEAEAEGAGSPWASAREGARARGTTRKRLRRWRTGGERPARGLSFHDTEIEEVAGEAAPAHVDALDAGRGGAVVGPHEQLFQLVFFAFGEDLDGAVGSVLDTAGE